MQPKSILAIGVLVGLILASTAITGCLKIPESGSGIGVVVTIGPEKEMVEAVGGELVSVTVMVPKGQSPHSYSPTPSQIIEASSGKLYFEIGTGIEFETNHLSTLRENDPNLKVIDLSDGIELQTIHGEPWGANGTNTDAALLDPHIWLSPANVKIMVGTICKALSDLDPTNAATYEANREAYLSRLDELIHTFNDDLGPFRGQAFLSYHGAWGYLAEDLGLTQLRIQVGSEDPGPSTVIDIIEKAKENNITVVFVSPAFDQEKAGTIASSIGGTVVSLDPLAEGYIENMRDVDLKLKAAFGKGG